MKKVIIILAIMVCFILSVFGGCAPKQKGTEGKISVNIYAGGNGTTWIEEAISIYKKSNPEVEFDLEASPLAFQSVKTMLENGNCFDDIILVQAADYESFVAKGYLEDLSGLLDEEIPGTEKKAKSTILPQVLEARTIDGKVYGIPWQANNPSGLVYNKKMFEKYGWDSKLPETMDEFWQLCDQITADTNGQVAPVTFGGANGNGYLFNNFSQWLLEYYGYDNMRNFLNLESPKVYEDQAEGRAKVYETIAKFTKGKTDSNHNIALEGSEGATAITAQTNFVNNKAAMIVSGQFFPTEMAEYIKLKDFQIGYLPMPHINADKKSGDGKIDTSKVRLSSDNGVIAVPTTAPNKELAKDFLLSMFTSESYTSFVRANNGLQRPLQDIEVDSSDFNPFTKAYSDYFYADGEAETLYIISKDRLIEKYVLNILVAHNGSFFGEITGQTTYESALAVAKGCVASEMTYVYSHWDADKQEWK